MMEMSIEYFVKFDFVLGLSYLKTEAMEQII